MTIRVVGLPSQVAFVKVAPEYYLNLAGVTRINKDDYSGKAQLYFEGVPWRVSTTVEETVAVLKTAGFTIIEGLV